MSANSHGALRLQKQCLTRPYSRIDQARAGRVTPLLRLHRLSEGRSAANIKGGGRDIKLPGSLDSMPIEFLAQRGSVQAEKFCGRRAVLTATVQGNA